MGKNKQSSKSLGKALIRRVFEMGQRLKVDVLPRHFYSEIPSIVELKRTQEWRKPYSMQEVGGCDLDEQLSFLQSCVSSEVREYLSTHAVLQEACVRNGAYGFGPAEAEVLFAVVATKQPSQIFQIGCGVSTAICLAAAEMAGYQPEILCVEPYPTDFLTKLAAKGQINLMQEKAQQLDMSVIDALKSDVLFFVDSSHTLGPAGEVSRIILEMLPRLKAGALVHFHDIYFPYDYEPGILDTTLFFWHESVLLHAFLTGNTRFRIQLSLSMLHYGRQEAMNVVLPHYTPAGNEDGLRVGEGDFPASTYLRVTD